MVKLFKKFLTWQNILFVITLLFIVFITLYPKLPILDIKNTWVYIRLEDFVIAVIYLVFGFFFLRKWSIIKTPLTIPIFLFWGVGLISTLIAISFIFPQIHGHPNLAFLHFLRRIEYMGLFFVGFAAVRDKSQIKYILGVLGVLLFVVFVYGVGQKYGIPIGDTVYKFPAFLTGNEEFAKGVPLRLSEAARVTATFAGHYDLAAWIILIVPIMFAMVFAYKKIYLKAAFLLVWLAGLVLLMMTASRISFIAYIPSITLLLILIRQKKYIIPVLVASLLLASSFEGISSRFASTISQVDLIVDARTGKAIGVASSEDDGSGKEKLVIEDKQSTGEDLPEGSGFINIPGKGGQKAGTIEYRRTKIEAGQVTEEVETLQGDFIVKRALAYDVSFTTRFQGTWPRAINAFLRNPITGSGFSSINIGTDGNYFRLLGEIGILGISSFLGIFLIFSIYVKNVIGSVRSTKVKHFVLGVTAGVFGLGVNAVLIDVFEASKVAFVMWPIMGFAVGLLHLYQKKKVPYKKDLIAFFRSYPLILFYLGVLVFLVMFDSLRNYFVADDFTWLRWAADCKKIAGGGGIELCEPTVNTLSRFFTDAQGFFYRPGTKLYFYGMYSLFWLNNVLYHVILLLVHTFAASIVYLLAKRWLNSRLFAFVAACLFAVLAIHSESLYWISVTGHLVAALCVFLSLLFYSLWRERKNILYFVLSLLFTFSSMFFHEFGIVTPLIIILYDQIYFAGKSTVRRIGEYMLYFLTTIPYLWLRYISGSHWSGGDYSYNLAKLPFNVIGNLISYVALVVVGFVFLPYQNALREFARENIFLAVVGGVIGIALISLGIWITYKKVNKKIYKTIFFGFGFFVIALLPFLALGNASPRYVYLASFGLILVFVLLLQQAYKYLLEKNKVVASVFLAAVLSIVFYWNIAELRRANNDWARAGVISDNLVNGFYQYFVGSSSLTNPVFYFVDVPGKYGNAYLFPTGVNDALWFAFQNENLTVHQLNDLEIALDEKEGSRSAHVFQFLQDGTIEEVVRKAPKK